MATFEELLEHWDGELAVIHRDRESGGWIFICMHSTQLGPAAGGTRLKVYETPADGLRDAMRLSAGMTAKLAVADLGLGGGKAVLALPEIPQGDERRAVLHCYGGIVASLGGGFITSSDVGTGESDMDVIAERTEHVFGRSQAKGGAGDPGPFTAVGVFHGLKASVEHVYGSGDLSGRSVLVQGVGSVGAALAELLARDGAAVLVADVDGKRAGAVAAAGGGPRSTRARRSRPSATSTRLALSARHSARKAFRNFVAGSLPGLRTTNSLNLTPPSCFVWRESSMPRTTSSTRAARSRSTSSSRTTARATWMPRS